MLYRWPKSVSDYKWPRGVLTWSAAPRRWLGATLFHLSHAAGRVVSFFNPNRPGVLIIRTDGIGDAVLAEPMMHSLSRRYADRQVHLWAPQATCDLMRGASFIDQRMLVPPRRQISGAEAKNGNVTLLLSPGWRARLGYRLGRYRFTVAVYLTHSPEPMGNWLLNSARSWQRWYAPGDTENQFASQRAHTASLATSWLGMQQEGHDLSHNAAMAAQWGGEIQQTMPTVHVDEHALEMATIQNRAWRQTAKWLGASGLVGLMPATTAVKQYPPESWAAAARDLWNQQRIVCALLGGPGDGEQIEQVSAQLGSLPHLKMASSLDLPAVSVLIGSLDGLLSVDTGMAHIAMAQDVPTVVLVGGGHPGRFFPWPIERRAKVLNHAMPCDGCLGGCHLSQPECVTEIEPSQIVAALSEVLDRRSRKTVPLRVAV